MVNWYQRTVRYLDGRQEVWTASAGEMETYGPSSPRLLEARVQDPSDRNE